MDASTRQKLVRRLPDLALIDRDMLVVQIAESFLEQVWHVQSWVARPEPQAMDVVKC